MSKLIFSNKEAKVFYQKLLSYDKTVDIGIGEPVLVSDLVGIIKSYLLDHRFFRKIEEFLYEYIEDFCIRSLRDHFPFSHAVNIQGEDFIIMKSRPSDSINSGNTYFKLADNKYAQDFIIKDKQDSLYQLGSLVQQLKIVLELRILILDSFRLCVENNADIEINANELKQIELLNDDTFFETLRETFRNYCIHSNIIKRNQEKIIEFIIERYIVVAAPSENIPMVVEPVQLEEKPIQTKPKEKYHWFYGWLKGDGE